jgi:hypothetical protein
MSLYLIGIGGTGAKFIEAVIHLAAAGLLPEETIRVLFVDPDEANGNLDRARRTLDTYRSCFNLITQSGKGERDDPKACPWMKTPIESFTPNIWSPLGNRDNRTLASLFNYNNYTQDAPMRHLFDVLYTERERETSLDVGFRGRPAIGAAVMSKLNLDGTALDEEPWITLFNQIKSPGERQTTIFLCGSAFGGTGASGFPTLGQLIHNQLERDGYRNNVKLGGALLLPYFEFPIPSEFNNSDEIYARPEQFLLNTEAALRYYRTEAQGAFNTIYLLGNQSLSSVEKFSLGRGDQRNEPHFIELYAALALRHFIGHQSTQMGEAAVMSRASERLITWTDLPPGVKEPLVTTTRFAVTWTAHMLERFDRARNVSFEQFPVEAPWSIDFFHHRRARRDLPDFVTELDKVPTITAWCESYLRWLSSIHTSAGNDMQVQLFNRDILLSRDSSQFFKLVAGDGGRVSEADNMLRLTRTLTDRGSRIVTPPNEGMVGLARALHVLCKP